MVSFFESELDNHKDRKANSQWAIELLASRRYKRYLKITKGGLIRIDHGTICNTVKYDGKLVLETNSVYLRIEISSQTRSLLKKI